MKPRKWLSLPGTAGAAVRSTWAGWWKRLSREDLLPGSLAVLAAALTLWIAFETALPAQAPLAEPVPSAPGNHEQGKLTGDQDLVRHYIRDITRRPLFKGVQARPATRGRTAPAVPPPVSPAVAEDYELMGVIGGETPEAIILNRRTGKTCNVTVGQAIDDMTVQEIAPRSVVLQTGKGSVRIEL